MYLSAYFVDRIRKKVLGSQWDDPSYKKKDISILSIKMSSSRFGHGLAFVQVDGRDFIEEVYFKTGR